MKKDERDEYQHPGTFGRRDFLKLAGGGIVVAVSLRRSRLGPSRKSAAPGRPTRRISTPTS